MSDGLTLTEPMLAAFAALTDDHSPLHMDAGFARRTRFRGRIAHGLLPVACLLVRHAAQATPASRALRHLSCKFVAPVRVGDTVYFAVEQTEEAGRETLDFRILAGDARTEVTRGKAVFARQAAAPADNAPPGDADAMRGLLREPVQEAAWRLADLAVGHTERIYLDADAGAAVHRLVAAPARAGGDMANLSAALVLSTLVGMRLPGRFATFLECAIDFEADLAGAVTLSGTVGKASPSGRLTLDLQWRQADAVIGKGTAAVLLAETVDDTVSCAHISDTLARATLTGRIALVTGASRGIGAATAKLLAMQGARVVVHYFQGRADAEAVVDDIRASDGVALALGADLRHEGAVHALFARIAREWGTVDILVNNAVGDFSPIPVEQLSARDLRDELDLTLVGAHTCCQCALPGMKSQRRGKIVNMGSIATATPVASQARYAAAKSALVGYTRSLALELSPHNIQVNLVVPAMTLTSLIAAVPRSLVERIAEDSPSGQLLQPIEVAGVIAFLVSDGATPISGQQIVLNQGLPPFL
ncbi:MAG: SDR family oxidoreductase [Rhodocyclaceae bacterium]